MTAHVTRDGKFREGAPNEIRQSLDVETEEIVAENGQPIPVHSGVRLGIYSARPEAASQRLFHYGERLRLPIKLKLPRNFRNPGAFDYQGYLAANGISALGSAKAEDVATHSPASPAAAWNSGDPAFTRASSPKCKRSGLRPRPRSSTPW